MILPIKTNSQLYLQRYPHFRATVSDALLFIEAEHVARTGDISSALAKMKAAFAQATGEFQQHVFTSLLDVNWLTAKHSHSR